MKNNLQTLCLLMTCFLSACDVSLSKLAHFQLLIEVEQALSITEAQTTAQTTAQREDQNHPKVQLYQNAQQLISKERTSLPIFFEDLRLKGDLFVYIDPFMIPIFDVDYEDINQIEKTFSYHLNLLSLLPTLWLNPQRIDLFKKTSLSDQAQIEAQNRYLDFLNLWQTFLGGQAFLPTQIREKESFSIADQSSKLKESFNPKILKSPNQFAFFLHTQLLALFEQQTDLKKTWIDLFEQMKKQQLNTDQRDQWFHQILKTLSQRIQQIINQNTNIQIDQAFVMIDQLNQINQAIFEQKIAGEWLWLKDWLICPRIDLSVFFENPFVQTESISKNQWDEFLKDFQCDQSANTWQFPLILTPNPDSSQIYEGTWAFEGDILSTKEPIEKIVFEIQWQSRDWAKFEGSPIIISKGQHHHYRLPINSHDFQNETIHIKVIAQTSHLQTFQIFSYQTKSDLRPQTYRFQITPSLNNEKFDQLEIFEWDQGQWQKVKVQPFSTLSDQTTSVSISTNQRYLRIQGQTEDEKQLNLLVDTKQLSDGQTLRMSRYEAYAYTLMMAKGNQASMSELGEAQFSEYIQNLSDEKWGNLPWQATFDSKEWQFWETCFDQRTIDENQDFMIIQAQAQAQAQAPLNIPLSFPAHWTKSLYEGCLNSIQNQIWPLNDQLPTPSANRFERQQLSQLYLGAPLWSKLTANPNLCDLNLSLNEDCFITHWETQAVIPQEYEDAQKAFDWQDRFLWLQTDLSFDLKIQDRYKINALKLSFRNQQQTCINLGEERFLMENGEDAVETHFQCKTSVFQDTQGSTIEISDLPEDEKLILEIDDLFHRSFQKQIPLKRSNLNLSNQIQIIPPPHCRADALMQPNEWYFYCGITTEDFSFFQISPKIYSQIANQSHWQAQINEGIIQSLSYEIPQADGIDSQILTLKNPLNQVRTITITINTDREKPILKLLDLRTFDEFALNAQREIRLAPSISCPEQSSDIPNDQTWYLSKWYHWINPFQDEMCQNPNLLPMQEMNCQSLLSCFNIFDATCNLLRNEMVLKWQITDQNHSAQYHLHIQKKNLIDQTQTTLIDQDILLNSFELPIAQILMPNQSFSTEYFQLEAVVTDLAGNRSFPLQQSIQFKPILAPLSIQSIPSISPNLVDLENDLSLLKNPIVLKTYQIKSFQHINQSFLFKMPANIDLEMRFDQSERIVNTNGQLQLNTDCFGDAPLLNNRFLKEPNIQLNVISLGTCMDLIQKENLFSQSVSPKIRITRTNQAPEILASLDLQIQLTPFEEIKLEVLAQWPLNQDIESILDNRSFNYPYALDLQGGIGLYYDDIRGFLYGWRIWYLNQALITIENQPFLQLTHPINRLLTRDQILDPINHIQTNWIWRL